MYVNGMEVGLLDMRLGEQIGFTQFHSQYGETLGNLDGLATLREKIGKKLICLLNRISY